MIEFLLANFEAFGGSGLTAALGYLLLKRIKYLQEENTSQHEQGRQERVASEARVGSKIDKVDARVGVLQDVQHLQGEDIAYIRGRQDASS